MPDQPADLDNPWRQALEGTGAGIWDWNVQTGVQSHSARWESQLGYQAGELKAGVNEFLSRIHPDDAARRAQALDDYLSGRSDHYDLELRLRCKDGSYKWIWAAGCLVAYDELQRPLRMIGVHFDIDARKRTEAAVHALMAQVHTRDQILQETLSNISQGVVVCDAQGHVVAWNQRVCELTELPAQLLASRPKLSEVLAFQSERHDFDAQAPWLSEAARRYLSSAGQIGELPERYVRRNRAGLTIEVHARRLPDGGEVRTVADISEHVRALEEIQRNELRWRLAFEATGDGVWDWHVPSGREYLSPGLLALYGYAPGELAETAESLRDLTHPDDLPSLIDALQAHLDARAPSYQHEHRLRCKNGAYKWILSRGLLIERDPQGQPLRMIGTHTDISARKAAELQVWQQARIDALTGLPNRRLLRERLDQELARAAREGERLAVLFLDLDRFKEVNDTLGHDQGDCLLVEAARRIRACLRVSDTVARMGGDEFAILLPDAADADALQAVLNKILASLNQPFTLRGEQAFVSASLGVTLYPDDAREAEDLFKHADQALYVAKGAGRNRFHFFTPELQQAALDRAQLLSDLREALAAAQFNVVYQPIVDLASGQVHKAEALLRWQHPQRGAVSPAQFIPVAESGGLIVALGEWVFGQAAAQVRAWRERLHPAFQISINKSPLQFENPDRSQPSWRDQLLSLGLPGQAITAEITEGLLLSQSRTVIEELLQLTQDGIQVSLDDFGTGYSSLAYLQRFSVDFVKIDQSFVRQLSAQGTSRVLCRAIISMAHALDMRVIAEGVETQAQRDLLALEGCDFGQGYLFARPMPPQAFEAWVQARGAQGDAATPIAPAYPATAAATDPARPTSA